MRSVDWKELRLEAAEELMAVTQIEAEMVPELVVLKVGVLEVMMAAAAEQGKKEVREKYVRFRMRFWLPALLETVRDVHS